MLHHCVSSLTPFPDFVENLWQWTLVQHLEKIHWEICLTEANTLVLKLMLCVFDEKTTTKRSHQRTVKLEKLKDSFIVLTKLKLSRHQDQVSMWRTNHTYPQIYAYLKLQEKG